MIQLQITGRHFELDRKITKYINAKIGGLDKYAPKLAAGAKGDVVLHLDKSNRENNDCVCEVALEFPGQTFRAKEATLNMYAAIDICEAKLRIQIGKYKDKHTPAHNRGRLLFGKMFGRNQAVEAELTEDQK